jgi:hypothetical protein
MARAGRIIAVTLGLSAAGAVFGGFAGVVALALSLALTEGGDIFSRYILQVLAIPAILGSALGALGAPAAAWLLLRRVPLGKVFLWTVVGTVTGGVAGWIAGAMRAAVNGAPPLFGDEVIAAILGAVAGFLATALLLRLRASSRCA